MGLARAMSGEAKAEGLMIDGGCERFVSAGGGEGGEK